MCCQFFKSQPIKYGATVGVVTLLVGLTATTILSFKLLSQCSKIVDDIFASLGDSVNIPELTGSVSIRGRTTAITLKNISVALPDSVINLLDQANTLPNYCFVGPFFIGLCLTIAMALSLASCVSASLTPTNPKKDDESFERDFRYSRLPSGSFSPNMH